MFLKLDCFHKQPLPSSGSNRDAKPVLHLHANMTVYAFTAPPKPRYFWRVTDSTSLTRVNHKNDFDTGAQLWGHWSYWTSIVNTENLDNQIDWSHRFTPTTADGDGNDPPLFVSVTDDVSWASDEFDRRFRRRREEVRIHVIDTATFEWDLAFLECGARLPVLTDLESGCTIFSSRDASKALNWHNRYRNSREWFAIKMIPSTVILPDVWGNE
ncbi:hypothetical protein M409DRAFT_24883 [Zasmidium cellare ATCC 36951]|uniref:DUF7587 domain-containing protein n=1 Tax=Zasmidium cellare ATCC 36951 TaxID=1080233 RepID=A0A6A6CGB6_ZASCE|nr:uncharacterized protein M409DRAFT_24883 [Zasmidium cellare ATCC 36951]KAF2164982.1 hypothetical protein M409DRAFT_24883 [Zasmidium cellare ATCC 36951]